MGEEYIVVTGSNKYSPEALSVYRKLGKLICLENPLSNSDGYLKKATVLAVRLGKYLSPDF